jgi:transcriptional regulator with XRE-family HTH domain
MTPRVPNDLLAHRERARLLQSDVARQIGIRGTERISRWERGLATPSLLNLFKLAVLYGVPPQTLYREVFEGIENSTGNTAHSPAKEAPPLV